ncbi:hypothetical protein I5H01_gp013 [Mycobacterium phage MarkPhew]|uniref:Uncharacterized protein n=1 Tax=Mycobacterium phage MarkPhew TaxID=2725625 RepID=A0A6M3TAH6_9CAUD|nr:hypothetical protein I5H01_gp013 [Mycobacterium phage MarkPhew]QJD50394.1 hypothetical protein SEA_MARKPHEW_94 [Mycobacterium phage MarkPhew]
MTNTLNATAGLNFNLNYDVDAVDNSNAVHGFVTGVTMGVDGPVEVFAKGAEHDVPEGTPLRMMHVKLGAKVADSSYGRGEYAVESWEFITRDDFDRIVELQTIRESLGWRD